MKFGEIAFVLVLFGVPLWLVLKAWRRYLTISRTTPEDLFQMRVGLTLITLSTGMWFAALALMLLEDHTTAAKSLARNLSPRILGLSNVLLCAIALVCCHGFSGPLISLQRNGELTMTRLLLIAVLCLISLSLFAQDTHKIDVFGGYQYLHSNTFVGDAGSLNASGWNAAAAFNFSKHLGVAADFSGNYQSANFKLSSEVASFPAKVRIYTYTFGPVFSVKPKDSLKIFAHALFGGAHLSPTGCVVFSGSPDECGSGTFGGFTTMLGGGLDAGSAGTAFRVVQFDWVYLPADQGGHHSSFRLSTGLVFRF